MARYQVKAKDGPGQTIERIIEGESRAAVLSQIERQGLIPVYVREVSESSHRTPSFGRRVRTGDVTVFTRQLGSMIRAGVPVLRAMRSLHDQTESDALQPVISHIEHAIRDGSMFSEAIRAYPRLFSPLYIRMVEAGEAAGVLDTILLRMADAREREEEGRRQVQAAMAYPVLVAIVGTVTVVILLTYFMPRVVRLFDQAADLPFVTRVLLGMSNFLTTHGYWVLLAIALFLAVLRRLAKMETGRIFMDSAILRAPLIGRFVRDVEMGRFARTFGLLVDAGIPIERVLQLSGNTMGNAVLQREVDLVRTRTVEQGMPLSGGLHASDWFPAFFANMVAVGEETGRLEESLEDVARYYDASVKRQGRVMGALIEPLLLLVVGSVVGFIVFAMLMPIFELGGRLQ